VEERSICPLTGWTGSPASRVAPLRSRKPNKHLETVDKIFIINALTNYVRVGSKSKQFGKPAV
jgi:hypothetical protein